MSCRKLAAAILAASFLAGCTANDADPEAAPRVVQPGEPGEPTRELSADEIEALDLSVEYTDADVSFMQGMIPHHAQALVMTRLVPTNSSNERLALFAERMDLSQEDEIALMSAWLEERDEPVPSLLADHEHGEGGELMPGMLTDEELGQLEGAEGAEFDRLFLDFMIQHHLGAISMVEQLFADGGGADPEVSQFANHVVSDQQIEISRMQGLLAELESG